MIQRLRRKNPAWQDMIYCAISYLLGNLEEKKIGLAALEAFLGKIEADKSKAVAARVKWTIGSLKTEERRTETAIFFYFLLYQNVTVFLISGSGRQAPLIARSRKYEIIFLSAKCKV